MGVSSAGVSDFAYTTDGRAAGVSALNSGGTDSVGGHGESVVYATEPGAIAHILAQDSNKITAEDTNQLITQG